MASNALALLEGDTLRLRGVLDRAAVIALWPQLQALPAQLARLELGEVERVDSAGLALLAELAARARKAGHALAISGAPRLQRAERSLPAVARPGLQRYFCCELT